MAKELDRNPRKVLGKGLSALLPPRVQSQPQSLEASSPSEPKPSTESSGILQSLALDQIQTGADQPREVFNDERLQELAQSIRANGLIQPITVYPGPQGKYTIIAGERRWRAARIAGQTHIMAFVRDVERHRALELALIENLQREDLNAVEVANGFQRLVTEYGLSHEQIAERTGKDRSTVTNLLRLLRLSPAVLEELARGRITVGHARALLNLSDPDAQLRACQTIIGEHLSVRQTEALLKRLTSAQERQPDSPAKNEPAEIVDPNIRAALDEMAMALGTRVRLIPRSNDAGKIEIEYYSPTDLDRIYSVIVKQKD